MLCAMLRDDTVELVKVRVKVKNYQQKWQRQCQT